MSTKTEPISVRDFLRNFANITSATENKRYIVMKHGRPIGVYSSWDAVKKEVLKDNSDPWGFLS